MTIQEKWIAKGKLKDSPKTRQTNSYLWYKSIHIYTCRRTWASLSLVSMSWAVGVELLDFRRRWRRRRGSLVGDFAAFSSSFTGKSNAVGDRILDCWIEFDSSEESIWRNWLLSQSSRENQREISSKFRNGFKIFCSPELKFKSDF